MSNWNPATSKRVDYIIVNPGKPWNPEFRPKDSPKKKKKKRIESFLRHDPRRPHLTEETLRMEHEINKAARVLESAIQRVKDRRR